MKYIDKFTDFILEKLILEVGEGSAKAYPYKIDDDFPTRDGAKYRDIRFERPNSKASTCRQRPCFSSVAAKQFPSSTMGPLLMAVDPC